VETNEHTDGRTRPIALPTFPSTRSKNKHGYRKQIECQRQCSSAAQLYVS